MRAHTHAREHTHTHTRRDGRVDGTHEPAFNELSGAAGERRADKQYITHSEWTRDFGGVTVRRTDDYKRLPFNFCALSLAPFENPVCTEDGIVFDLLYGRSLRPSGAQTASLTMARQAACLRSRFGAAATLCPSCKSLASIRSLAHR